MSARLNALVEHLKKEVGVLRTPRLERAFKIADRAFFVPAELKEEAYEDYPLPIGGGQTISQPTTVAFMLEKLDVRPGDKVLDVGSGSGWTAALLENLVGRRGRVVSVEVVPELVAFGQRNLTSYHSYVRRNAGMRNVPAVKALTEIRLAKKGAIGLPGEAPFDKILVSAGAAELPLELVEQLREGGRMVLPVNGADGSGLQTLVALTNRGGRPKIIEQYPGFAFVPLISA